MLLNLLFPRRCVSCNKLGKYICNSCLKKINFVEFQFCPVCRYPSVIGAVHARCQKSYSLDGQYTGAHYTGIVRKAIHFLKYRYVSDLVEELAGILFLKLPPFLNEFDLLLPVPLHSKRLRERGFNQSFLIAKSLSKKLSIPVKDNILIREKHTKPQFGLNIKERNLNIQKAFKINCPEIIKNKKIVLVDDVATTFSTLKECTKVLKRSGAKTVWAIVLAHGS